jgi:cobaltochelatase CobN
VEPVWDRNKNVIDVRLIPIEDLGRPRIDVVVTMSGIYRENWPHQIELINKAVRIASESDDSAYHRNFVNESTQSTYNWLIEHNYTELQARELSLIRIFGPPDGVWGVGGFTGAIGGSGTWENESTLADLYIRNMANVYGDTIWGEQYVDFFKQNLNGTEVALFGWSSHSHSVLGIDHTFEFFGGLSMAVRSITGEAPDMYINNLKNPNGAKLETLSHVIMRDLRSMYFNELWIKGMMEHGYAGAREIATIMANLWGWDVTCPDVITKEMWNEMYDIYVQDKYNLGLKEFFDSNNPYAQQSITARMLEAIRKGYWSPSEDVKTALAETYQKSVEEYGVTCCHHTCGNPLLQDYLQGILSVPEEPSKETNPRHGGGGARMVAEEENGEGFTNMTETAGVSKTGEELKKPPEEASEKRGKVMKLD